MSTTLFLIRHGQTASNLDGYYMGWDDVQLNEVGYTQADQLAKRLASYPIAVCYSSPLKRALTTAKIVSHPHGIAPLPMPQLMEMNYGIWQGLKKDEVKQKFPNPWRKSMKFDPDWAYPGGESYRDVFERSIKVYVEIVAREEGKLIAVVSHQTLLKAVIMHILGATYQILPRIEFGNTSLTIVEIINHEPRLVTMNDMSHIEHFN